MKFDSICRTLFLDITKQHGVEVDEEPIYDGREYLEKQKNMIKQQDAAIAENETKLDKA